MMEYYEILIFLREKIIYELDSIILLTFEGVQDEHTGERTAK